MRFNDPVRFNDPKLSEAVESLLGSETVQMNRVSEDIAHLEKVLDENVEIPPRDPFQVSSSWSLGLTEVKGGRIRIWFSSEDLDRPLIECSWPVRRDVAPHLPGFVKFVDDNMGIPE